MRLPATAAAAAAGRLMDKGASIPANKIMQRIGQPWRADCSREAQGCSSQCFHSTGSTELVLDIPATSQERLTASVTVAGKGR